MIRLVTFASLLLGLAAFADDGLTDEQQCQMKCSSGMQACMAPCLGSDPKDAMTPENRPKTLACIKKCADGQKPCMNQCSKKKK